MNVQQMSLLDPAVIDLPAIVPPPATPGRRKLSIAEQFMAFHRHNPQVYTALHYLAFNLVASGRKRGSINQLFEVLRYEYSLRTHGDDYKLNNNYRSHYARLLMNNEPALRGWFETRDLRS